MNGCSRLRSGGALLLILLGIAAFTGVAIEERRHIGVNSFIVDGVEPDGVH